MVLASSTQHLAVAEKNNVASQTFTHKLSSGLFLMDSLHEYFDLSLSAGHLEIHTLTRRV